MGVCMRVVLGPCNRSVLSRSPSPGRATGFCTGAPATVSRAENRAGFRCLRADARFSSGRGSLVGLLLVPLSLVLVSLVLVSPVTAAGLPRGPGAVLKASAWPVPAASQPSRPALQQPAAQEPAAQQPAAQDPAGQEQETVPGTDGSLRQPILDNAFDFSRPPVLPAIEAPEQATIQAAIDRGVQFLVQTQNADGSWGSHDAQRPFQIYAPIPGAHHGFKAAVTAMAISALIECAGNDPAAQAAVLKGYGWMQTRLDRVKRATGDAIYNVWAHTYAIQALVRLHERVIRDEAGQRALREMIARQLDLMDRYESVDGGWGYYDFNYQARKPTSDSTSFVNAAALIAMREAEAIGVTVNQKTVERAIKATLRQQKPDFTYLYGEYLDKDPVGGINRPAGSLGRSQACNAALRIWGDQRITDNVLKNWLYRLYVRNDWLGIGRKRPIPHEAWFQVAGYFYYFGHYYAAVCIDLLPAADREPYQAHLAKIILQYQEPDGSWWDYPLYGYHKPYGTAYAVMTLQRCLKEEQPAPAAGDAVPAQGGSAPAGSAPVPGGSVPER